MPTKSKEKDDVNTHTIQELTELLIKHHGLHVGVYELAFEMNIAVGAIPMPEGYALPGAAIGFSKIGIKKTDGNHPNSVDAAAVNPRPKKAIKTKSQP
ncbi:hypothetical protein MCEGE14_00643 [Burkholderiaceae bacterium]